MKLMIADDEVIIRQGLSTVIDWKELGITLLEPAASAEEVLERLDAERPHILLTDIRMGGMDGIELSREVKRRYPDTEIIILTGFDEFAYAQQAIHEGVSDYLLKTSRPEEIIKAAVRAKGRVMERLEARRQEALNAAAVCKQLLERLLTQGQEGWSQSESAKLRECFVRSGLCEREGEAGPIRVLIATASGWGEGTMAGVLIGAVENMLSELLGGCSMLKQDRIVMIVPEGTADAQERIARELGRVKRTLKCLPFAALSSASRNTADLKEMYAEASNIFAYRGMLGNEGLFTSGDIGKRAGGRTVCTEADEAELAAHLAKGSLSDLRQTVNRLVRSEFANPEATPETLLAYLQSIVIAGYRWLERARGGTGDTSARAAVTLQKLPESERRAEEEIFRQLSGILAAFHESVADSKFAYIPKSIAYIRDNLDQNLTLQQVAAFVHLNPNHFSEMFKRELGMTYIEFVVRERMAKAERLLKETPLKVSEIAAKVGYEDVKYFGQLFKKHTGMTPSEYRES